MSRQLISFTQPWLPELIVLGSLFAGMAAIASGFYAIRPTGDEVHHVASGAQQRPHTTAASHNRSSRTW